MKRSPTFGDFEWQEGYGAFSIGVSGVEDTTRYIMGQEEHHVTLSFKQELEIFLKKHGMEYVESDLDDLTVLPSLAGLNLCGVGRRPLKWWAILYRPCGTGI